MKEKFYFQHDYDAADDPKICVAIEDYGGIAYAMFFYAVELMHREEDKRLPMKGYVFKAIALKMKTDVDIVKRFIDDCIDEYGLFDSDGDFFFSKRVFKNIEYREEANRKKVEAGRKGGIASGKSRKMTSQVKQNEAVLEPSEPNEPSLEANEPNEPKEKKRKEIKEKEIKSNIVKKEIPTFSMIYKKFPKSKLDEELKDKATWERFSDEDKIMAYELADIYLERNAEQPRRREYMPVIGYYLSQTRFNYMTGVTDKYREKQKAEKELAERRTDGDYILKNPDEAKMVLKYIKENLPIVSAMKYQMNLAGADKLCYDYGYDKVMEKLIAMESWEPIKDKDSVVNVCRQWLAKGYGILVGGKDPKKVLEMQKIMSN